MSQLSIRLTQANVCLPSGHGLTLRNAAGVVLRALQGRLWLTLEGEYKDVDLRAGSAYTIERDGLTLVNAQEASLVVVEIPEKRPAAWRVWLIGFWELLVRASAARARARMARGLRHW